MIRILHAADLHLDSPFSALPPEQAVLRRAQQRQLPQKLAELCRVHGCDLLLLAGDVFDGSRVCPETIEALQAAFSACSAEIFIAPGNHDPYTDDSPWNTASWPEHVHIFSGRMEAITLPRLSCRVWGAGFRGQEARELLQPISPDPQLMEIGVLHGDPLYPGCYNHITAAQLQSCGLDYLALGHIHKRAPLQYAGRTAYGWPGAAMGRGFDETGLCGVYLVEVSKSACTAEFLPLDLPRYEQLRWDPADGDLPLPKDSTQVICRLTVTGSGPFDEAALRQRLQPLFYALELRDETEPARDIWAERGQPTLRGIALEQLFTAYSQAETAADRSTAALAAQYVLHALEGRELP